MLIGFRLRNFRSFMGDQLLSYVTTADHSHESTHCIATGIKAVPRLSRSALVIGPNAAGKTNLVIALSTMRELVLNSTSFTEAQFADRYTPFQFGTSHLRPTEFEIDVTFEQVRYRYAIAYTAQRITYERLLVYRTGKSQRWFERRFDETTQSEEWTPFSPNFTGPREMWRKATRSKALFLSTAAQLNSEHLQPLLHWFEHCLEIVLPSDPSDWAEIASQIKNEEFKAQALRLFRSVGIHIDDLRVADPDHATDAHPSRAHGTGRATARPMVEFLHSQARPLPVWLDASVEASGIHRLLGLLGPLMATIAKGKLLAIDEFDTSLHPLLTRFLIALIHARAASGRCSQLLLTSRNTTLLDLEIMRRDEIWLLEADESCASHLAPLLRFSPRKNEMIGKGYLQGRYGAVPKIRPDGWAPEANSAS